MRPVEGAEPSPSRVRQQGNWSQYTGLPGSAPNAVQEAAAYQLGACFAFSATLGMPEGFAGSFSLC